MKNQRKTDLFALATGKRIQYLYTQHLFAPPKEILTVKIIASLIALTLLAGPAHAQSFSDAQKKDINAMIESYIKENPKALLDSVVKYQEEQAAAEQAKMDEGVKTFVPSLKEHKDLPSIGNKDGDVTIVEFFDYNCGYCKKAYTELQKIIDEDKKVNVILIDLPILGPNSAVVSKWALAAQKQDKYFDYHKALMNFQGQKTDETLEKLAKDAGLDVAKLKKDKDDPAIEKAISRNQELAASVSVQGTPGFIINDQIIRGYMEAAQMKEMIKTARNPGDAKDAEKKAE